MALLWEDGLFDGKSYLFDRLLGYFPALAARLNGVERDSRPRGAGPLARRAQKCVADRLVLLGDAAGYLDAITGEGLSLAFAGARSLGEIVPEALLRGASARLLEGCMRGVVAAVTLAISTSPERCCGSRDARACGGACSAFWRDIRGSSTGWWPSGCQLRDAASRGAFGLRCPSVQVRRTAIAT